MKNFQNEDGIFNADYIYDLSIKTWVEDLKQLRLSGESEIINKIKERYDSLGISDNLDDTLVKSLVSYSALITTNKSANGKRTLQFGDLFQKNSTEEFFICITPHCDCAIPGKINHNYYFIKGEKCSNKTAIEKSETGFYSYLDTEGSEPICIEWSCKPFTVHLKDKEINDIQGYFLGSEINLIYQTTVKENFTQRLSNEAFSYGYRVGINLPY